MSADPDGPARRRTHQSLALLTLLILALTGGSLAVRGASQATMGPATAGACPSPTLLAGTVVPATQIPTTSSATEISYQTAAAKTMDLTQQRTPSSTQQAAGAKTVQATETATAGAVGCPRMAVTMAVGSFFFHPNQLAIPANTNVLFTFTNADRVQHSFVILTDQVKVKVLIAAGSTVSTTLNLPKGTYQFYCIMPGHKAEGMVGQLIVG